jgi:hypothetical protein
MASPGFCERLGCSFPPDESKFPSALIATAGNSCLHRVSSASRLLKIPCEATMKS